MCSAARHRYSSTLTTSRTIVTVLAQRDQVRHYRIRLRRFSN
jgi:hypothetical protein